MCVRRLSRGLHFRSASTLLLAMHVVCVAARAPGLLKTMAKFRRRWRHVVIVLAIALRFRSKA
jgi:hypothetical protein